MNYENSHRKNVDLYARQIDQIYQSAVSEATAIGQSVANLNGDKLFSFADYPITHDRIDKLINKLKNSVETIILNGIDSEWTLSNNKNNELCNRVFGDNVGKLSKEQYRRYYSTNGKAQDAFKARKVAGLGLSDRVWSYTKQFKTEIELGLDLGIGSGLPTTEITRDLKEYLKYPDKLFRRVRDKHGALQLSKAAKAFNPGQGVYRSSYKNALRLTRTETNIAYRTADHERWQQFDFVVGIEIKKSANHPIADMCDNLAGKYPKDFKFTGWHPQCRCYAVSILKTSDEMERDTQRILSGEPIDGKSVNSVNDTPLNFKDWIEDNQERIDKAKQLPYFLRDNRSFWEKKNNAKSVRRVKTDAEKIAIQKAWEERKNRNNSILYSKISKAENEIRMNAKFETAILYDTNGSILIDKRGKATSVSFDQDECKLMKDGILTHNHPRGWGFDKNTLGHIGNSFSPADLCLAVNRDLAEIRAVTPTYTFVMKRPINGWGVSVEVLKKEIEKMKKEIIEEFRSEIAKRKTPVSIDRANVLTYHKLSKKISDKYGWEYSKAKTR